MNEIQYPFTPLLEVHSPQQQFELSYKDLENRISETLRLEEEYYDQIEFEIYDLPQLEYDYDDLLESHKNRNYEEFEKIWNVINY